MTTRNNSIGIFFLLLLCLSPAFAQTTATKPEDEIKALRQEIEAVKAGQTAIQKDLLEIKNLLRTRPGGQPAAARDIVLDISEAPVKGPKDAKVVLVEFSDYQCPYCARFSRDTIPLVQTDYVDTGKIKYVFADFPLEAIHPYAFKAAEAASCAGDQGEFWKMHDHLFANQKALKPEDLIHYAEALGLDKSKFQQCLDTQKRAPTIRKTMAQAGDAGVSSTPTLMVGLLQPNSSKVKVLRVLKGAQPFAAVKDALDNALKAPVQ